VFDSMDDENPSEDMGAMRPMLDLGVHASEPDWSRAQHIRKAGTEALRAVRDYATKARCRRQALLGYFGDEAAKCGGCDVCEG
jgi:ATP-dependent DNA helicase RecQ